MNNNLKLTLPLAALLALFGCDQENGIQSSSAVASTEQQVDTAEVAIEDASKWMLSDTTSPMDDSRKVVLTLESNEKFRNRYGRYGGATLALRCIEGQTTFLLGFNEEFLSDHDHYRFVEFRLDSEPMFSRPMSVSTNNEFLGFWRSLAIPAIEELFEHEKLTVRATPYNKSPVVVTFDIKGVEHEVEPLKEACNW